MIFLFVAASGYVLLTLIGAKAQNYDFCFPLRDMLIADIKKCLHSLPPWCEGRKACAWGCGTPLGGRLVSRHRMWTFAPLSYKRRPSKHEPFGDTISCSFLPQRNYTPEYSRINPHLSLVNRPMAFASQPYFNHSLTCQ